MVFGLISEKYCAFGSIPARCFATTAISGDFLMVLCDVNKDNLVK